MDGKVNQQVLGKKQTKINKFSLQKEGKTKL